MRRLSALCLCLCLTACASRYGDHPPYRTSGQLLVNGRPAPGARVVFHHLGDWGEKSIVPQGMTDEDGRFTLSTYDPGDGAPAGDYRVVVEWPAYRRGKNVGPDRLGGKFARADSSGLTAHVEAGTNQLPPFELQAKLIEVDPPDPKKAAGGARTDRKSR
jgi:hypothetical protein